MDFTLTDDQQLLRETARKLLDKECPPALVRAHIDDPDAYLPLWEHLGEYTALGLGYKAKLQALSGDIQYPYVQNTKNKVQFSYSSWYQDYPAASDFLVILLGCDSFHPNSNSSPNIAGFCDQQIEAKMDQASTTGITDPAAGNKIWAQVDKEMTDQAPWVSMFNPKYIDFISERVKGYEFSPQWYFLLGQASVE